jgi:hypothetical protein
MRPCLLILPSFVVLLLAAPVPAAESCNQIEVTPGGEATISVLLPDIARNLRPRLTDRDASESKPVDPWGTCPTAEPYGPCAPAAHATLTTGTTRKIFDPGDGMQLLGFRMRNAAGAPTRTLRLCVQYE